MGKPDMNQVFDHCIKEALRSKAHEVSRQSTLLDRINTEINYKEMENISMNNVPKLKRLKPLIIALVFILSAATCFAASQISSMVSVSTETFKEFPSERQVEKAVDYIPDYIEAFSNGFQFESASIDNTEAFDSEDNKLGEGKGISFDYTNDKSEQGQFVCLNTEPEMQGLSTEEEPNQEVFAYGDIKLNYTHVISKVSTEGYVPTEEEQRQIDQGELWLSCGSEEKEATTIQYVTWVKDDISYNLMEKGCGLTKDEIIGMAKEVIGDAE